MTTALLVLNDYGQWLAIAALTVAQAATWRTLRSERARR